MSVAQRISDLTPYYKIDYYFIPNTDNAYIIATNGVVLTGKFRSGWSQWGSGSMDRFRPMKARVGTDGYLQVGIPINGRVETKKVHQLVCEAVHGPAPEGMEVCHGDGNKLNCWSWNLSWGTRTDNLLQRRLHGTVPDFRGEKSSAAKLNWEKVRALRADWLTGKYFQWQLAEKYLITQRCVSSIVTFKTWIE